MPETESVAPVVAVTGASGYVGGLVCARFAAAGWTVVRLQRTIDPNDGAGTRRFVLGDPVPGDLFAGVDVLIHCAWDLSLTDPADVRRVDVDGSRLLFEAAAAQGVSRSVFISSMSAYWGTEQVYGTAKLACEEVVAGVGGVSVRLGLVHGQGWGGMAGSLRKLVELPVTPLVGAKSYQYTVHEDDVADGLLAIATAESVTPGSVIGLAHSERVPFRTMLEGFGRRAGTNPRLVPVPWRPVFIAMRTAERMKVRLPLRADSLLGLVRPAGFVPSVELWPGLGIQLRAFSR